MIVDYLSSVANSHFHTFRKSTSSAQDENVFKYTFAGFELTKLTYNTGSNLHPDTPPGQ